MKRSELLAVITEMIELSQHSQTARDAIDWSQAAMNVASVISFTDLRESCASYLATRAIDSANEVSGNYADDVSGCDIQLSMLGNALRKLIFDEWGEDQVPSRVRFRTEGLVHMLARAEREIREVIDIVRDVTGQKDFLER